MREKKCEALGAESYIKEQRTFYILSTISSEKAISIIDNFLSEEKINILEALEAIESSDLYLYVKFEKYESCINAHSAKLVVDFQNTIYRIAALLKYGRSDARHLTREEKLKLEVPFRVSKSSTEQKTVDLIKTIKELIDMIPEDQRTIALVAILVIIFGYLSWIRYLSYKEKSEGDKNQKDIIEKAIDKIAEQNRTLSDIIKDSEKKNITNLCAIDNEIDFQGYTYNYEQLKKLKSLKFPPNKKTKEISKIEGLFIINDINLKENYIIAEHSEDKDIDPIRIYYDKDNLMEYMQSIKDNLKKAIDEKGKIFYIVSTIIKKGQKIESYILQSIKEYKTD